jgi:uncharacterized phage-like protein YoqJ
MYDQKRKDSREWKFYKTRDWERIRLAVLIAFKELDIYAYYIEKKIQRADTVHHIVEIKDDWDRRLEFENLFPCSRRTHSIIHILYDKDQEGTQKFLNELIDRWKSDMNVPGAGGV